MNQDENSKLPRIRSYKVVTIIINGLSLSKNKIEESSHEKKRIPAFQDVMTNNNDTISIVFDHHQRMLRPPLSLTTKECKAKLIQYYFNTTTTL